MEIEAIYNKGKLEFLQPVRLVRERLKVRVLVPDEELVSVHQHTPESDSTKKYSVPYKVRQESEKLRSRLDKIRNAPFPPDSQLPPLSEKQEARIKAFAMREEIKGER
jgi:predicted DNA-binding antitoxin AbrB/MazE fold protein